MQPTTPARHGSTTPDDPVRIEVEAALALGKRTVPVVVGGASLPATSSLPPSLAPLFKGHSAEPRDLSWSSDLDRLMQSLRKPNPQRVHLQRRAWAPP